MKDEEVQAAIRACNADAAVVVAHGLKHPRCSQCAAAARLLQYPRARCCRAGAEPRPSTGLSWPVSLISCHHYEDGRGNLDTGARPVMAQRMPISRHDGWRFTPCPGRARRPPTPRALAAAERGSLADSRQQHHPPARLRRAGLRSTARGSGCCGVRRRVVEARASPGMRSLSGWSSSSEFTSDAATAQRLGQRRARRGYHCLC